MSSAEDMADRRLKQLLSAVTEDPNRLPMEKETGFLWAKDTDEVHVHTAEAGLMRRLLRHPEFTLRAVEMSAGGHSVHSVHVDNLPSDLGRRSVYSIEGTLPLGCLSVKSTPRVAGGHARVVSPSKLLDTEQGGGE